MTTNLEVILEAVDRAAYAHIEKQKAFVTAPVERVVAHVMSTYFAAQGRRLLADLDIWLTQNYPSVPVAEGVREAQAAPDFTAEYDQIYAESTAKASGALQDAMTMALNPAMAGGMAAVGATLFLPKSFAVPNARALAYLEKHGAELVTGINETTRKGIRDTLAQGRTAGKSYTKVASDIRNQFEGFTKQRSTLIAVTESANAYEQGGKVVIDRLSEQGLEYEKSWLAAATACKTVCGPNANEDWIAKTSEFQSGDDIAPGHPGCRCTVLWQRVKDSDEPKRKPEEEFLSDEEMVNADQAHGFGAPEVLQHIGDYPNIGIAELAVKLGVAPSDIVASKLRPMLRTMTAKGDIVAVKRGGKSFFTIPGPGIVAPHAPIPVRLPVEIPKLPVSKLPVSKLSSKFPTTPGELAVHSKSFVEKELGAVSNAKPFTRMPADTHFGGRTWTDGTMDIGGPELDVIARIQQYPALLDASNLDRYGLRNEAGAYKTVLHEHIHSVHSANFVTDSPDAFGKLQHRDRIHYEAQSFYTNTENAMVSQEGMTEYAAQTMFPDYATSLFGPERGKSLVSAAKWDDIGTYPVEVAHAKKFSSVMAQELGMSTDDFVKQYVAHGYMAEPLAWTAEQLVGKEAWARAGVAQQVRLIEELVPQLTNATAARTQRGVAEFLQGVR